jgi:hypothetical protein
MNDTELDRILDNWEAPAPSPALRENVRHATPPGPRQHRYRWAAAAASMVMTAGLLGVAMLGKGEAQLGDGSRIQTSTVVEPAGAAERWRNLGFGSSTGGKLHQAYWYDPVTHTYSGYDLTIEPVKDGKYLMTARPLRTPLQKLSPNADAKQYQLVEIRSLPASRLVLPGAPYQIVMVRDAKTGEQVSQRIVVTRSTSFWEGLAENLQQEHMKFARWLHSLFDSGGQLRLKGPSVSIDGKVAVEEAGSDVMGGGVYFHLPGQGRYVLTLDPGHDGRFVRAGTVNGKTLEFELEGKRYQVTCRADIALGKMVPVYVYHDTEFRLNPQFDRPGFGAGRPERVP